MSTAYNYCCHCQQPLSLNVDGLCRACRRRILVNRQYFLIQHLSTGGFASVYLARNNLTGELFAVKVVTAQTDSQYRQIETEVATLSRRLAGLRFVPQFQGAYLDGSEVYIVMEYIPGATLDRVRQLPWAIGSVSRFLKILLAQLQACHERGVIHRDIKPQNIIRTPQGDYFLIDFGIAKQGAATRTVARGAATPNYAPIEQLTDQTSTPQSDLYSLGVTAYELLTGVRPPTAIERLGGTQVQSPSDFISGVPARLEQTIMALIELRPLHRPASAEQALNILRDPPPLIQAPPRPVPQGGGGGWATLLGVSFLAAVIVAVGGALSGQRPTEAQTMEIVGVPAGRLVFSSNREGNYDLYLADAGGGPPWNMTSSTDQQEHAPSWSGDGSYVAYVARVGNEYAIARLDLETRQRSLLTPLTPGINYGTPAVSPDGALIAYNSGPEGNYDLYVMRADGSNPTIVARGLGLDFHPAWFPDSKRLIYVSHTTNGSSLMVASVEGVALGVLYSTPQDIRTPAVSPDGSQLVFAMGEMNDWKLYIMPLNGGEPQRLTREDGAESYPAWSADGQSIMFMSTRDNPSTGDAQLFLVDSDGSDLRRVFFESSDDRQPSWRP